MTERWQRELKKLGGVDAPVSRMRAQIAAGPSEDPPQPEPGRSPRQRITAGVVAFAVFAAAGAFAYRALQPRGVTPGVAGFPTVTIDLSRSSDASPTIGDLASLSARFSATVTAGESSIEEAPSSVCGSGNHCLFPAPIPLNITLTSGSLVRLSAYNVDGRVELSQTNGDNTDTLLLTNDSTLPSPGHYLLQLEASSAGVSAFWNYTVDVAAPGTVQTPAPTSSPMPAGSDTVRLDINTTPGTSDCPGGPEGTITYRDQSTKAFGMSFTWTCPGSGMAVDTTTPSFTNADFVQVPIGTRLLVAGDLTAAEGQLQTYQGDFPWKTVQDFGNVASGLQLSFDPGRYIIEVTAHWSNGDRRFYFPIELVPPASATPPPPPPSTVPSPSPIPDVLKVSCDGGAPLAVTPTVAAQHDGVHVQLVGNPLPNTGIAFFNRRDGSIYLSRGDDPAQGLVWQLGAGTFDVKCYEVGAGVNPAPINAADSVDIVDPNGFWVSTYLDCLFSGQIDVKPGGHLPNGSAEASIRAGIPGLLASDTIEPAGYVRAIGPPVYRVVRNGSTIAALSMGEANDVATVVACNDAGLG